MPTAPCPQRPKTAYTEDQIEAFYAELKRQAAAGRDPRKFSGFYWGPLNAIAGGRAFEVFGILRARSWIVSRTIPNTYGHQEHELTREPN